MGRDHVSYPADLPKGVIPQLFFEALDRFGDAPLYRVYGDGGWPAISYREAMEAVRAVAGALKSLGLERGDRLALLSENRPEWAMTDMGCQCAGVQDVPIYATLPGQQIEYLLNHSGARVMVCSTNDQLRKILEIREQCEALEHVVLFDDQSGAPEGVIGWQDFLELGRKEMEGVSDEAFREEALSADPDDVATMIYTSGTTGTPKGVMLTHNNLFSNARAIGMVLDLSEPGDSTLSFLPLSHVFQRTADYVYMNGGATISYARSMRTVAEDLRTVRPTKVNSVPRFYEKVYQKVMDVGGIAGAIVRWARGVGAVHAEARLAGRRPGVMNRLAYRVAHALVFKKITDGMGGRLRYFVSGGAPLSPDINRFFYSAGILILEGYGLSETSPVTNVNTPENFRIGTVGKPIPGTEIRIAGDGEILIRGPQVMKGYYKNPEATAEAIDDEGWFRTGDIGVIDDDGFLRITDRKKDIIVTAGGKNIAPQPIENRLKTNPWVDQAVMIGDRRKFPSLLIVPAFSKLEEWARGTGISFDNRRELLEDARVQKLLEEQVLGELTELAHYETPRKVGLLADEFTIESGALTPTEKVKRRVVEAQYQDFIESLYEEDAVERTTFVA